MNGFPILSWLVLLPLVAAVLVYFDRRGEPGRLFGLAVGAGFMELLIGVAMWSSYDTGRGGLQFVERHDWIPTLSVKYLLGADGLSILMVLLTAIVLLMSLLILAAPRRMDARMVMTLLCLEAGLMGTFTAQNFVHWFLFWELSLIPAFFLIRFWGGKNRARASVRFFLYTMVGSVALLLAFLALYQATGSFDFEVLASEARGGRLGRELARSLGWSGLTLHQLNGALFLLALLGVAVKVPLVPFHGWQADTYEEAPTGVTMVLTGVMSKMGLYALIRLIVPIFPEPLARFSLLLMWLALATILIGALAALRQTDLKRMLAYSSLNHLGYCLLAVAAAAPALAGGLHQNRDAVAASLNGAMLQMFNHGVIAAMLFAGVAILEQRSGGLRGVADFGGLRGVSPRFCGWMGLALMASLGLPGLSGFVGEYLIFRGVMGSAGWAAVLAAPALLITAWFLLRAFQGVFWGPAVERWRGFEDLTVRERALLIPAGLLVVGGGWMPGPFLELLNPVTHWLMGGGGG